jgi:hypothetical protein
MFSDVAEKMLTMWRKKMLAILRKKCLALLLKKMFRMLRKKCCRFSREKLAIFAAKNVGDVDDRVGLEPGSDLTTRYLAPIATIPLGQAAPEVRFLKI